MTTAAKPSAASRSAVDRRAECGEMPLDDRSVDHALRRGRRFVPGRRSPAGPGRWPRRDPGRAGTDDPARRAGGSMFVASTTVRRPSPSRMDSSRVELRERGARRPLVRRVARDERAERIGRQDLVGSELPSRECRLAGAGGADQHDEAGIGDLDGRHPSMMPPGSAAVRAGPRSRRPRRRGSRTTAGRRPRVRGPRVRRPGGTGRRATGTGGSRRRPCPSRAGRRRGRRRRAWRGPCRRCGRRRGR